MELDFTNNILALEVDKVYYEDTRKELSDQANESYCILDIDFDKVPIIYPPKNSSEQTRRELEIISSLQRDWRPSEELLRKCDDDPDGVVFGLNDKVNEQYLENMFD